MRYGVLILALLIVGAPAPIQKHRPAPPFPDHFVVARQLGGEQPFGSTRGYEVFVLTPIENSSLIEKIVLTPNECIDPTRVEYNAVSVSETGMDILGSKSPCAISEDEIARETRNRERRLWGPSTDVLQVQCGNQTRVIPSDLLDKIMSRPVANAPKNLTWTTVLFQRMDEAIGSSAYDYPVPPLSKLANQPAGDSRSKTLREVREGKYDALFKGASERPSDLYRLSQPVPAHRAVELVSALPIQPETFVLPVYPQLARQARVWGAVSFRFDVNSDGVPANLTIESGPAMLREAVTSAVSGWRFPKGASGRQIQAAIGFGLAYGKPTECP
jgi:Gram-negative bacterial TonB protein C-terminal